MLLSVIHILKVLFFVSEFYKGVYTLAHPYIHTHTHTCMCTYMYAGADKYTDTDTDVVKIIAPVPKIHTI